MFVRKFLLILFFAMSLGSYAQQGLVMDFGEIDSSEMRLQRNLEYYQLISGSPDGSFLIQDIDLPNLNLQQEFQKRYSVNFEFLSVDNIISTGISSRHFMANSPLSFNGTIFSEQAFQVNDKLIIGGYSYGALPIVGAQNPSPNQSYFGTYGSTMFMQYKVSKNISIETSISVGQQQGPPGF